MQCSIRHSTEDRHRMPLVCPVTSVPESKAPVYSNDVVCSTFSTPTQPPSSGRLLSHNESPQTTTMIPLPSFEITSVKIMAQAVEYSPESGNTTVATYLPEPTGRFIDKPSEERLNPDSQERKTGCVGYEVRTLIAIQTQKPVSVLAEFGF